MIITIIPNWIVDGTLNVWEHVRRATVLFQSHTHKGNVRLCVCVCEDGCTENKRRYSLKGLMMSSSSVSQCRKCQSGAKKDDMYFGFSWVYVNLLKLKYISVFFLYFVMMLPMHCNWSEDQNIPIKSWHHGKNGTILSVFGIVRPIQWDTKRNLTRLSMWQEHALSISFSPYLAPSCLCWSAKAYKNIRVLCTVHTHTHAHTHVHTSMQKVVTWCFFQCVCVCARLNSSCII